MDYEQREAAFDASPWNRHADRTHAFVLGWESGYVTGLRLALKHCTKYEDRQWLSFLIEVAKRNGKEEKANEAV